MTDADQLADKILLAFAATVVDHLDHKLAQFDVTCRGIVVPAEIRYWFRMSSAQYSFWIGTRPSKLIRESDLRSLALSGVRIGEIEDVEL